MYYDMFIIIISYDIKFFCVEDFQVGTVRLWDFATFSEMFCVKLLYSTILWGFIVHTFF